MFFGVPSVAQIRHRGQDVLCDGKPYTTRMSRPHAFRHTGRSPASLAVAALLCAALPALPVTPLLAGPWVEAGDSRLRSDIQLLADAGVIEGSVTTWPLAWADVMFHLEPSRATEPWEIDALDRVLRAARRDSVEGYAVLEARVAAAGNPVQFRSFEQTPREDAEVGIAFEYTGDWLAVNLEGTWADDPQDDREWRADGSYAALALGNWTLGISAQDRWWGPGWSSSMIYSSNARPVPSISFDRMVTAPFENRWLAWLGYWDLSVQVGQLESDRAVPDALLFAARLSLRPLRGLEIGLSRSAQLCGEGRTCDLDTWTNMLLGKDNRGDNVSPEDEPGNQLGGWDVRWSSTVAGRPYAAYTQWIGEDEGGGLPAKYTALFGLETWGGHNALGTWRTYLEWADTMCNFALYKGSDKVVPDCAYNNAIYETGYRYRGRSLASTFDNDASVFTLGTILTTPRGDAWLLKFGYGNLNRKRAPDARNTVATDKTRYREVLLTHRRSIGPGELHLGAGYDQRKDVVSGGDDNDARLFVEWRQSTR